MKKIPSVDGIKRLFDQMIEWEKLPVTYEKSRNGWAGYRGTTRITKFYFSEDGAREEVIAQDARRIKVQ